MTERNRRTQTRPDLPDPNNDPRLLAYLRSVADWHGYMRFLGLPHLHETTDEPLSRLFVEPHVHEAYHRPDEPPETWANGRHRLIDLFGRTFPVLLLGDPGTGKSTLLNWVAWNFTRWDGGEWLDRFGPLVPIPLVIRELGITSDITWDTLCDKFLQHGVAKGKLTRDELNAIIWRGQAFVLVDGLDELSDLKARERLRDVLGGAMAAGMRSTRGGNYSHNYWLLTSRIIGYDEVPYDHSGGARPQRPGDTATGPEGVLSGAVPVEGAENTITPFAFPVRRVYCCPLDDRQVEQFARTWFVARETKGADEGQRIASKFLSDLRAASAPRALARIPNLLTLFALVYRVLAEIPHGRSVLYGKVAEAYLESIDKARGMRPKFTRDRMERWLAFVAFHLQRRRDNSTEREILFHRDELLDLLVKEMPAVGGAPSRDQAREFLDFAARRSGLLLPRGEDRFAFMHLSFQEYFAARFLKEQITSPKWVLGKTTHPGTSPPELNAYADRAVWTETMVLLFELLKSEPQWTEALRDTLFGERYVLPDRDNGWWGARPRLLAELLIDPHTGIEQAERERDLPELFSWELRRQKDGNSPLRDGVLPTLLLPSGFEPSLRIASFWEQAARIPLLQRLSLSGCASVTNLAPLANITSLENLDLSGCAGVTDLTPLAQLVSIRYLTLSGCVGVTDLTSLANLTGVGYLDLSLCTGVTDLTPLAKLTRLERLDLSGCAGVTDLSPLAKLARVKHLALSGCAGVTNLTPLARLSSLKFLTVNDCAGVTDIMPLAKLMSLETLHLSGCTGVTDLAPLAELPHLRSLFLSGCTGVTDLTPLVNLTGLFALYLDGSGVSVVPDTLWSRVKRRPR